MSNRPIHFENGAPPPPKPIQTMEELLDSAQTEWKCKRKDEAFVKVLGAMAMMSAGVAQAMKTAEAAVKEVERLERVLHSGHD